MLVTVDNNLEMVLMLMLHENHSYSLLVMVLLLIVLLNDAGIYRVPLHLYDLVVLGSSDVLDTKNFNLSSQAKKASKTDRFSYQNKK